MYYAKSERPAGRENLKHWIVNVLLLVGCFGTFLILGGCKEQKTASVPSTTVQQPAGIDVDKEKMEEYLNNTNAEKMPTPEIITEPPEPSDTLNEEPPVTPQVGGSF